ncbi:MAG: hypothetical protein CR993_00490 [Rhodobacterales bacterium]|nr:MAG: hypothetical protein CR993_00490 [Rhodobacterales bacterium]
MQARRAGRTNRGDKLGDRSNRLNETRVVWDGTSLDTCYTDLSLVRFPEASAAFGDPLSDAEAPDTFDATAF